MATVAMGDQQLEKGVEQLESEIGRARVDLAEWEGKQREASSLLAELQRSYAEAAAEVVQGRRAPTEKLAKQIEDLREKLLGFGRVIDTKREQLSDLQARLQPLHAEQSRLAQAQAIHEEKLATERLIAETEAALARMNEAAAKFVGGVNALRERSYIAAENKRLAFDSAQTLARRSNGFRT
jgi:chromosome segregation ATPase